MLQRELGIQCYLKVLLEIRPSNHTLDERHLYHDVEDQQ